MNSDHHRSRLGLRSSFGPNTEMKLLSHWLPPTMFAIICSNAAFAGDAPVDLQPPQSFLVEVDATPLFARSPTREDDALQIGNMVTMLFAGDACQSDNPRNKYPLWTCNVDNQMISGYAARASFRDPGVQVDVTALPGAEQIVGKLRRLAENETIRSRKSRRFVESQIANYRVLSRKCRSGQMSDDICRKAAETRINLYATGRALHPRKQSTLRGNSEIICDESLLRACLLGHLGGSGWLAVGATSSAKRFEYVLAQKQGSGLRFVHGIAVGSTDFESLDGVSHITSSWRIAIDADEEVSDHLFPVANEETTLRLFLSEPLRAHGYLVTTHHRSLLMPRPFAEDEEIHVLCKSRIERIVRPQLTDISVAEVEWGDGGLYPEYHYLLPCDSIAVVDGKVDGLHIGGFTRISSAKDVVQSEPTSPFAKCVAPADRAGRGCEFDHYGDFNNDGRVDALVTTYGEMGCGGTALYLSTESGWQVVAVRGRYC